MTGFLFLHQGTLDSPQGQHEDDVPTKHPNVPHREQSNFFAPIAGTAQSATVTAATTSPVVTSTSVDGHFSSPSE